MPVVVQTFLCYVPVPNAESNTTLDVTRTGEASSKGSSVRSFGNQYPDINHPVPLIAVYPGESSGVAEGATLTQRATLTKPPDNVSQSYLDGEKQAIPAANESEKKEVSNAPPANKEAKPPDENTNATITRNVASDDTLARRASQESTLSKEAESKLALKASQSTVSKEPKSKRKSDEMGIDFAPDVSPDEKLREIIRFLGVTRATWAKTDNGKLYQVLFDWKVTDSPDKAVETLLNAGIGRYTGTSWSILSISVHREPEDTDEYATTSSESDDDEKLKNAEDEEQASIRPPDDKPIKALQRDSSLDDDKTDPTDRQKLLVNQANQDPPSRHNLIRQLIRTAKSRVQISLLLDRLYPESQISFDFMLLVLIASLLAAIGLCENSSVVLVASMLVSPIMGPILGLVFGTVTLNSRFALRCAANGGVGLFVIIVCGFLCGFISYPYYSSIHGTYPTEEMTSRTTLRSLVIGMLIAIPSGIGVTLAILGNNIGPLVGVAISAALLPPCVNTGLLWSAALLAMVYDPQYDSTLLDNEDSSSNEQTTLNQNSSTTTPANVETTTNPLKYSDVLAVNLAVQGCVSFLLTLVNILCIFITACIVLRLKGIRKSVDVDMATQKRKDTATTVGKDVREINVNPAYYQTVKANTAVAGRYELQASISKTLAEINNVASSNTNLFCDTATGGKARSRLRRVLPATIRRRLFGKKNPEAEVGSIPMRELNVDELDQLHNQVHDEIMHDEDIQRTIHQLTMRSTNAGRHISEQLQLLKRDRRNTEVEGSETSPDRPPTPAGLFPSSCGYGGNPLMMVGGQTSPWGAHLTVPPHLQAQASTESGRHKRSRHYSRTSEHRSVSHLSNGDTSEPVTSQCSDHPTYSTIHGIPYCGYLPALSGKKYRKHRRSSRRLSKQEETPATATVDETSNIKQQPVLVVVTDAEQPNEQTPDVEPIKAPDGESKNTPPATRKPSKFLVTPVLSPKRQVQPDDDAVGHLPVIKEVTTQIASGSSIGDTADTEKKTAGQ